VEYELAAGDRTGKRGSITQISRDRLNGQFAKLAAGAAQGPDLMAAFQQGTGDVPAKESGRTGDED
jgi:hypothetical protein